MQHKYKVLDIDRVVRRDSALGRHVDMIGGSSYIRRSSADEFFTRCAQLGIGVIGFDALAIDAKCVKLVISDSANLEDVWLASDDPHHVVDTSVSLAKNIVRSVEREARGNQGGTTHLDVTFGQPFG